MMAREPSPHPKTTSRCGLINPTGKKPRTRYKSGRPRMAVRLHDGGTPGFQPAEPSEEARKLDTSSLAKGANGRAKESGRSLA